MDIVRRFDRFLYALTTPQWKVLQSRSFCQNCSLFAKYSTKASHLFSRDFSSRKVVSNPELASPSSLSAPPEGKSPGSPHVLRQVMVWGVVWNMEWVWLGGLNVWRMFRTGTLPIVRRLERGSGEWINGKVWNGIWNLGMGPT